MVCVRACVWACGAVRCCACCAVRVLCARACLPARVRVCVCAFNLMDRGEEGLCKISIHRRKSTLMTIR